MDLPLDIFSKDCLSQVMRMKKAHTAKLFTTRNNEKSHELTEEILIVINDQCKLNSEMLQWAQMIIFN